MGGELGQKRAVARDEPARRDIRADRDRFVAFSFAAADLLIELDGEGVMTYVSGAARRLTGHDAGALLGKPFFDIVADCDRRFAALTLGNLAVGARLEPISLALSRPDGADGASVILSGCRLPDDGAAYLAISAARPLVADQALANRRDRQTGLMAVADFQRVAGDRLRVAAEMGGDVRLTLLDLCGLDELAERVGPAVADSLLSDIGATLRLHSTGGNSAGQLSPGRMGLVHGASTDPAKVRAAVEELGRAADPTGPGLQVADRTVDLEPGALSAEDGAKAIAYALSRFASAGAAAFDIASTTDSLRLLLADTVERISSFRLTVANRAFRVVYQPILSLRERDTHHWEALSRLEGHESPFETIRFAEGVEIVEEFDLAVVERVLSMLEARPQGSEHVSIAVNLSGRSIGNGIFVAALDEILARHPRGRRDIMFEITESTQISDLVGAGNVVRHLKQSGHSVCLDDFGAGAASFPYLQALPVDYVKIDGAYVKRVLADKRDRAILRSMTGLCAELGITTVAEMIETEDQATLLEELGVDLGQGWLFGRPVPELPPPQPKVLPRLTDPTRRR
jgi:PAS domain S-box-containing protein